MRIKYQIKLLLCFFTLLYSGCGDDNNPQFVTNAVTKIGSVAEFHDYCFKLGHNCEENKADVFLYFDTGNLPSHNNNFNHLIMCDAPPTGLCGGNNRLSFGFGKDETLGTDIDPGIEFQDGWKVKITDAAIKYCDNCFTNNGLAEVVSFEGSLNDVEFVHDPDNVQSIYINVK